jgi:hypothetical protein
MVAEVMRNYRRRITTGRAKEVSCRATRPVATVRIVAQRKWRPAPVGVTTVARPQRRRRRNPRSHQSIPRAAGAARQRNVADRIPRRQALFEGRGLPRGAAFGCPKRPNLPMKVKAR